MCLSQRKLAQRGHFTELMEVPVLQLCAKKDATCKILLQGVIQVIKYDWQAMQTTALAQLQVEKNMVALFHAETPAPFSSPFQLPKGDHFLQPSPAAWSCPSPARSTSHRHHLFTQQPVLCVTVPARS